MRRRHLPIILSLILLAALPAGADFPREHLYDTTVGPDEAAVNVSLVSNRWPDCTTLETAIESIFRLEGVADRTKTNDESRALAMWKWFRILVSATGGHYAYEGPACDKLVWDPHKIFTVYGHHQCDGQSWAMVPLWRAAGYMAFDECTLGHTIAALRYRDDDGVTRYHDFDPQGRFYYWDTVNNRVGCWSMPVFTGRVYRHVTTPQIVHSLRTSLRIGETVQRSWTNDGYVVPSGKPEQRTEGYQKYYDHKPGRTDGIYAAVGQEIQTLTASTDPKRFSQQLADGSVNAACSPPADGKATLHPAEPGKPAEFIYRLAPPYVAVDARLEATLVSAAVGDVCRLYVSRDKGDWQLVFDKKSPGVEKVALELGRPALEKKGPHVYTAYDIRIKAQFQAAGDARSVGMNDLSVTVHRMLNKRTLPNLMSGANYFRVNADKLAEGCALKLTIHYERDGQPRQQVHTIDRFPYYFLIDEPFELRKIRNYDADFNNEAVRMVSYEMALVGAGGPASASLPASVEDHFKQAFPHPGDMTDRKLRDGGKVEKDPMQTSGFLPQSRARLDDREKMDALIAKLRTGKVYDQWAAAQELGNYPAAVDVLIAELPKANIDLAVFVVKALAQIADPKAIDPLLAKWDHGMRRLRDNDPNSSPGGAPGSRYIPDALAAIYVALPQSQRPAVRDKIVPPLVAPLPKLRFDFRFHIAHALGQVGGPAAEKALTELAEKDWFAPIRDEARAGLANLKKRGHP